MGLRSQLAWLRSGSEQTRATLATYGDELRQLQEKVQALSDIVSRLDAASDARMDAMRDQLRAVTDDLGDRIGAIAARLESLRADGSSGDRSG
jgi:hypothetical protein